ncbi:MAG: OmpW family protein [Rhodanobacter sp.]|uniref:OmpW family protein n=1 Tax=Rhodanobacter glycinis TaxID=582702 RepID=A0A5B9E1D7_9GAMM|nr:OmpW family outer membrane protein [Rhodanobacter glycinis]QEE25489.1 OmpW family protein [Rhodanobacter glycinis]TAM24030.1 MAG: OmpW family protein [Rhodanobacter sp.]
MQLQRVGRRFGAMMAGLAMLGAVGAAQAQTAGSNVISVGWLNITPHNKSTPLTLTSINGSPVNIVQTGTGFKALEANTLYITFAHFFTDHISAELVGGIPTKLKFAGSGTLARAGTLGEATPIAPTAFVRYHFFDAQATFRPYVGLGINHTQFIHGKVTNAPGLLGPGATGTVSASSSWNPAYVIGATYAVADHWAVALSASYIPVKTTAQLNGTTGSGVHISSHATDKLDPVNLFLGVNYRF